jgi:hypothetical protein
VELALLATLGWWDEATFPWMGLVLFGGAFLAYAGVSKFEGVMVNPEPAWAQLLLWTPFLILLTLDAARLWQERVPPPKPRSNPA